MVFSYWKVSICEIFKITFAFDTPSFCFFNDGLFVKNKREYSFILIHLPLMNKYRHKPLIYNTLL